MKMKKYIYLVIILIATFIISCKPVQYGELGEPFSKTDGIKGTWKVSELIQIDETALAQGGLYTEMNLTDLFDFSNYTITFNVDNENNPSTFSVDAGGAPSFIDTTGTWSFDDVDYPTEVLFSLPDSIQTTSELRLIAPPRENTSLRIKFLRYSGGKLIVSYQYTFDKISD